MGDGKTMIKITPYFDLPDQKKILAAYLNMIADAVPFFPEDVLWDFPKAVTMRGNKPRNRTKKYLKVLSHYFDEKAIENKEKRTVDALLAQEIIKHYSIDMHEALYRGFTGGHVNPEELRRLLTFSMPFGKPPADIDYRNRRSEAQQPYYKQYSDDLYDHVFRYEAFSNHPDIYRFVKMLGVEVCPYCNRQYITTVSNDSKPIRPQLDHFKNKKEYPYFALSINNLIPSCGVCNLLKHNKDKDIMYPYQEGVEDRYVFRTEPKDNRIALLLSGARMAPQDFEIKLAPGLKPVDRQFETRIMNSIDIFAINDLYQSHKTYVSDMYFQRYIITDELIDAIHKQFQALFPSKEEVKQMLLMMNTEPEHWKDRPLAKLTHDIKEEIDGLY